MTTTTTTWFDTTARANFERHLLPLADQPLRCLQLGVWTGDASEWIMENLPAAHLTDVDTWEGSDEHEQDMGTVRRIYEARTAHWEVSGRIAQDEMVTEYALSRLWRHDERFDFIYIDADHHASAVLRDAVMAWQLLVAGGLMAFDDYWWEAPDRIELHAPRPGIEAFVNTYAEELSLVGPPYDAQHEPISGQVWVRKR